MKNNYEVRAAKFAQMLAILFEGCVDLEDFEEALDLYNLTHRCKLRYDYGVSRIAVIRSDYVVKCDIRPTGCFKDGHAGNCESEAIMYEQAVEDGFEYLLAKTKIIEVNGRKFAIMPRINDVNNEKRWWRATCTEEEERWLDAHIMDLHDGNVGYRNGKVCVIDYGFNYYI